MSERRRRRRRQMKLLYISFEHEIPKENHFRPVKLVVIRRLVDRNRRHFKSRTTDGIPDIGRNSVTPSMGNQDISVTNPELPCAPEVIANQDRRSLQRN
jgi:hypothetical protein